MAASSQCIVRFSEAWDDNDIIPPGMNISLTCEFQNASLTINLWHLDEKKIRMLKTLHADDIDVLARDRHRVNRDHALQLPYDEQDTEMATDHQSVYDMEIECTKITDKGPTEAGRSEWDRISSAVQARCQQQTFDLFWGKNMTEDSEPQMTTLNFPLFWDKQDEGGEPPTAAVEEDSGPLAFPSFPLFWESQAKENESGRPLGEDDKKTERTAEEGTFCIALHGDMREDGEPPTPNFPLFWDKQTEGGEPPTADVEQDSGPLALPSFPLFWESQAKDESRWPLGEGDCTIENTAEDAVREDCNVPVHTWEASDCGNI
ncbi:hypothetical protein K503DRAFT_786527 [Rhizopogon vinicolor AM-OR11-026]|uniref:Uncharacterized protein n=1 Tax=Rhizopogon vinicolor AM-OR11-026 TaxID=1314800 RepID=A0A1B7MLE5_9AGAM|nr:hypothetical protein K503DRAFT_786527 [Rhizopogon vinicolor AM-OR11-026]